jgi:diguanylate cyclase
LLRHGHAVLGDEPDPAGRRGRPPVRAGRRPALTWRPWSLGAGLAAGVTAGLVGPAPGVLLTLVGALVVERVVTGRRHRRELARVRRLAYTDDLTGLANRRALTQALDAALATGEPLGLVLLDLDGFKTVNDTYGHLAGDHVLRSVAVRLSQAADPGAWSPGRAGTSSPC